jgi:hypothetical protein
MSTAARLHANDALRLPCDETGDRRTAHPAPQHDRSFPVKANQAAASFQDLFRAQQCSFAVILLVRTNNLPATGGAAIP